MSTQRAQSRSALTQARFDAWVAGLTVRQRVLGLFSIVIAALLVLTLWQAAAGRAADRSYQALARDHLAAAHTQQLAVLEQSLRRREVAIYGTTLATCLLLFVVVLTALRPLYRGIEHLTVFARRLSAREFAARLHWAPPGELGELARALVTMQETVKHYAEELHEREFEARAASQAKSMFVASMSHEIRTPLVGVLGMLELLGRSRLDGEQRRQFSIVHESAQALLDVVGDVLDYSKIEAGKLEIRPETVALRDLVSRVIAMFSATAQSKGLQLAQAIDPELALAHVADAAHLMQVLRNFVSNGIKFTERGAVTLAVRVAGVGDGTQRVAFTVSDTGIGIAHDHLGRLFKPFSQVETGPSRRFGGTGLGLAICSRLAEAMGGAVRADSAPGVGTTMHLELELKVADPATLPKREALEPEPPEVQPAGNCDDAEADGNRILVAEDHPVNRQILTAQLRMAGFCVDAADDGASALQRFVGGRYGLVLTDLHMPGLDGFQLAAAIREHERTHGRQRTPIVALTADAVREHVEHCFAGGIDDYLCKPVPMRQLVAKLRQWLPAVGAT